MDIEVGGQIQGISLGSFLQIVHMDKASCTLKIYSNDDVGYLYLQEGALVAAEAGDLSNVEAAYEILSWNKTVIIIDNAPVPNQNIAVPLMSILMEGLRRKDEKNAQLEAEAASRSELDVEFDPETYVSKDDMIASQFVSDGKEDSPPEPDVESDSAPDMADREAKPSGAVAEQESKAAPKADSEPEQASDEQPVDSVVFDGEEDFSVPEKSVSGLLIKVMIVGIVLSVVTFGGLHFYKLHLNKKNHERIIIHIKSRKNLEKMKTALATYIGKQEDDSDYIPDAVGKMNELNILIEVDEKVRSLSINESYEKTTTELYNTFLSENKGTFLEEYVKEKLAEIPKKVEEYEFKKLAILSGADRDVRLESYARFLKKYPQSKHRQAVENMIGATGDESYLRLVNEINNCNKDEIWERCLSLADDFISTFGNDSRVGDVIELRKKMQDRAEFADLKFRASAMSFNDSKKMFIAYLKTHGDSSLKKEIRGEITLLNRKIDFQTKWEEARAYCTNPNIELYLRIRELKDYIERDYSGLFKNESGALMKQLRQEEKLGRAKMIQLQKERKEKERLAKIEAEKRRIAEERERARLAKIRKQQKAVRLKKESERLSVLLGQSGGRYTVNRDMTVTDSRTGLTWALIDSFIDEGECHDYESAISYVNSLSIGGYKDWRLPDTGELAIIYNGKPYFPSSGAPWYWTSETRDASWAGGEKAASFDPNVKTEFEKKFKPYNKCGYVHPVRP